MSDQNNSFDLLLNHRSSMHNEQKLTSNQPNNVLWPLSEMDVTEQLAHIPSTDKLISHRLTENETLNVRLNLSDFDFTKVLQQQTISTVYWRIAKEKPLNQHVIIESAKHLLQDGQLIFSGQKNEGILSLQKFATQCFEAVQRTKHGNSYLVTCQHPLSISALPANPYHDFVEIQTDFLSKPYLSKAGVFAKDKIDRGSATLIDTLDTLKAHEFENKTYLDLGCGSGLLSLYASQRGAKHVTATDNNVAAIHTCLANFTRFDVQGRVVHSYVAKELTNKVDRIVCNPPFHQGFAHLGRLIDTFLQATERLMTKQSKAYFVVNQFVGLETAAKKLPLSVDLLNKNNGFHVYRISRQ